MSKPGEAVVDLKDVELNEMGDPEKQPMAPTPGETNGAPKGKELADEAETKFTGLSKEELLKVAGTPGWVRTRWALLILFWAGWVGMLVGAVLIIVQAPRCRPLPPMEWWQKGALYQIGDVETFKDSDGDGVGDLEGVRQHMDELGALKVKGLVIGPIHATEADRWDRTRLTEVDPRYGTLEDFQQLLETARKKSIMVILDLTPNYKSEDLWFNNGSNADGALQSSMKEALNFWLEKGVAGIRLGDIDQLEDMDILLDEWKNVTVSHSTDGKSRVLFAVTDKADERSILEHLNRTSSEFLSSTYLLEALANRNASDLGLRIQEYLARAGGRWTSWSVGGPKVGHVASLIHQELLRLYNILLFTLPGTPFTTYGDEIGLQSLPGQPAKSIMHWDDTPNFGFSSHKLSAEQGALNRNTSFKAQKDDDHSVLALYKKLSDLKQKERSLLHGDFIPLQLPPASPVYAYIRIWDQNDRFLVALNLGSTPITVKLQHEKLPADGTLVLCSDPLQKEKTLDLSNLELAPHEGLLIKFPYVA